MRRTVSALLLVALAAGCSGDEVTDGAFVEVRLDLRVPDRAYTTSATLAAAVPDGFGEAAIAGWDRRAVEFDGAAAVWTVADVASLRLIVEQAGRQVVEVEIAAIAGAESIDLEAQLNGTSLGSERISTAPVRLQFAVPEGSWIVGDNVLTLRPSKTVVEQRDDGAVHLGVAVRHVDFESVGSTIAGDDCLTFEPNASAIFVVEGHGPIELEARCRALGAGTLIVEPVRLDHAHGIFVGDGAQTRIDLTAGRTRDLAEIHEPTEPGPLGVRLAWSCTGASQGNLVLERPIARRALSTPIDGGPTPVIFVSIDTLSARNMSLFGYERETTPRLAEFARDAVVFDACRANAPWTVPSYLSQFTGLLPRASRVLHDLHDSEVQPWDRRILSDSQWSLSELLRATGRTTLAVVDNPWLADLRGLRRGFDRFDDEPARRGPYDPEGGMRLVFERALEFLDEHGARDPFLFLQILDVHGPYVSTESFAGRYGSTELRTDDVLLPVVDDRARVTRSVSQHLADALRGPPLESSDVAGRRVVAAYDEGILEFDHEFGLFLDALRSRGIYDRAIVVVAADHGESMLESRFTFFHGLPNEQTVRVPLLVKLPDSRAGGRRVSQDVQLLDLYPTLAELTGVPVDDRELHGESLVPYLLGHVAELQDRPTLVMDGAMETRAIVDGNWKLTVYDLSNMTPGALLSLPSARARWREFDARVSLLDSDPRLAPDRIADFYRVGTESPLESLPFAISIVDHMRTFQATKPTMIELHDIVADPTEQVDRAAEQPEVVERLTRALTSAMEKSDRLRPRVGTTSASSGPLDLELLKALGYASEH